MRRLRSAAGKPRASAPRNTVPPTGSSTPECRRCTAGGDDREAGRSSASSGALRRTAVVPAPLRARLAAPGTDRDAHREDRVDAGQPLLLRHAAFDAVVDVFGVGI